MEPFLGLSHPRPLLGAFGHEKAPQIAPRGLSLTSTFLAVLRRCCLLRGGICVWLCGRLHLSVLVRCCAGVSCRLLVVSNPTCCRRIVVFVAILSVAPGGEIRSAEVSSSNRRETIPHCGILGVDRLSASFRLDDFEADPSRWGSYRQVFRQGKHESDAFSAQIALNFRTAVRVDVIRSVDGPVIGRVEFNPSRVVDPDGVSLCPVALAGDTFVSAVNAARALVEPSNVDDLDSYSLTRVDVAKDFDCGSSPSPLIRGLAPIPRKFSRKNLVHADPSRNGAQTLLVGSFKSGSVRLYDKSAETQGVVPEGVVRWECEARRDWIRRYGDMKSVGDLVSRGVEVLGSNRFDWSCMGVEITSRSDMLAVLDMSGLSAQQGCAFVGWLWAMQVGSPIVLSKNTVTKYRKIQRDLNIGSISDWPVVSMRLDWDSGEVITRLL